MPEETMLLLSCQLEAWSRFTLESITLSLQDQVAKRGGQSWAGWTEPGLLIRMQRVAPKQIRDLKRVYFAALEKSGGEITVVEKQQPETSLPSMDAREIPWGTVLRQKLTRKLLNSLPEGAYLVSNLLGREEEIFAERLGAQASREVIWQRAVLVGAHNRLCRVVWSQVDFDGPMVAPEGRGSPGLDRP